MKALLFSLCLLFSHSRGAAPVQQLGAVRCQPDSEAMVKRISRFHDNKCDVSWEVAGSPGTEYLIRGQVFLASSGLMALLGDQGFELKVVIPADKTKVVAQHALKLASPDEARPLRHILKWQAQRVGADGAKDGGSLDIRSSPRRLLSHLGKVSISKEEKISPLAKMLQQDGVEVNVTADSGSGISFRIAKDASDLNHLKLSPGQVIVAVGSGADWPEAVISKPQGAGQVILLPNHYIDQLPQSPALQNLLVSLIQPQP